LVKCWACWKIASSVGDLLLPFRVSIFTVHGNADIGVYFQFKTNFQTFNNFFNRDFYLFVTRDSLNKMGIRKLFLPRTELEYERHRVEKSRSNKNYETLKRHHHHHHQHRSSGKSSRSVRGSSRRHKRRHKFFDLVRFEKSRESISPTTNAQ